VITLLTYKIDVDKYTNNYVDTKCVIIRAMFTCYCESEKSINNWFWCHIVKGSTDVW